MADDVAAYRFLDGAYFVSRSVSIENSDTRLFLECLISGKASIYYTKLNSIDYYFLETDGKMVGINNNRADVIRNGVVYNAPSNQYRGVLKHYFRDCASVVQKLDNADFSKKYLIRLGKEYNECVCEEEPCVSYEKKFIGRRFGFGADFSLGKSKLTLGRIDFSPTPIMHYQFGITSQMNLDERGSFNIQVALRYYSFKNEILGDMKYQYGAFPSDAYYQYSMLKPEVQLKYKIKRWKLVPFASAGIFSSFFLSDKGYVYNERFDKTIPFTTTGFSNKKGKENGSINAVGEVGLETRLNSGNLSFSFFYENFVARPFQSSYNFGLRCGYFLYF